MLRKTKNKITWLILILLFVVTLATGTFPFFIVILIGLLIYNFVTGNRKFKEKKILMEDFLTHKYGEKMSKHILRLAMEKRKK